MRAACFLSREVLATLRAQRKQSEMVPDAVSQSWWSPFREAEDVRVIYVNLSPNAGRESAALKLLDEHERARWQRFEYAGPRRRFALCRAALRVLLCERLGSRNELISFAPSRYGKPLALVNKSPAPISFSVSHSGSHGLIAIAPQGQIGVDIEERDVERDLDYLVDTVMSETEKAELSLKHGLEKTHLFFKLWTLKEAVLKAHGTGFHLDASRIEIPLSMLRDTKRSTIQLPQISEVSWHVEDLGNKDFAAALAYELAESSALKD